MPGDAPELRNLGVRNGEVLGAGLHQHTDVQLVQSFHDVARVVLHNDEVARQAAAAAGYAPESYDLDCVHFHVAGLSDQAYVGAKGIWLQATDAGTLCHELGHNFGLMHANAWITSDVSVIGAGQKREYGNLYDTMGSGARQQYEFNACHKHRLGWLPDSAIQTVTSDGVYRLQACDTGTLADGSAYALRIRMDQERDYWIETRQQLNAMRSLGPVRSPRMPHGR